MSDLIGQSLGRYRILEQIGEGGMATVYKAYDTHLETEVAVKVIRTENILPNALARALKRFEREAKALARLTHPNIVKVTDYGDYEGKPYLVMPYLPGGTLKQRLGKPMAWQEAVQLLLPVAGALGYAHSQNMIHRDVKPSNILLTDGDQPLLTDFGIAKILDADETLDLTGTSAAIGTPEYMAPEQATAKTADHRADIYALGVVLYEMITGKKPYTADTPMAVLIMHARDPLPSPRKFVPGLPTEVEKILLKALAKSPEDRYQSMAEMVSAFGRILNGQSKKAPAHEKPERQPAEGTDRNGPFIEFPSGAKPVLPESIPFLGIISVIAVIGAVLLIALWLRPRLSLAVPTATTGVTQPPSATPTLTTTVTNTSAPTLTATPSGPFEYTIQEGDSLASIAQKFNLGDNGIVLIYSVNRQKMEENGGVIFIGQTIMIPPPGSELPTMTPIPANLPPGTKLQYQVLPGDTLAGIAAKFNSQQEEIIRANPEISGQESFQVGQKLQIPVNLVTPTATLPPTSTPILPTIVGSASQEMLESKDSKGMVKGW